MGTAVFALVAVGWLAFLAMLYVAYGRKVLVGATFVSVAGVASFMPQL